MWKQISDNTYTPCNKAHEIRNLLQEWYSGPHVSFVIGQSVPQWVLFDEDLFDVVLANVLHNACQHGKQEGAVEICVNFDVTKSTLAISVSNEPGAKHVESMALQHEKGPNFLFREVEHTAAYYQLGTSQSTYLGIGEVQMAALVLNASVSLIFGDAKVTFQMEIEVVIATAIDNVTAALPPLPPGMQLICADDDPAPRAGYRGLIRKLNIDKERCLILGETHKEALHLTETVLTVAAKHGDENVLCVFDQVCHTAPMAACA